jgi:hypothetical protein
LFSNLKTDSRLFPSSAAGIATPNCANAVTAAPALRSVGDRLLASVCAMLIRRTPFDLDYAVAQMAA